MRSLFANCTSEQSWLERAKEVGLIHELETFGLNWQNEAKNAPHLNLIIYYKDLITNPKKTINQLEEFYGLKQSAQVQLSKKRYSRESSFKRWFRKSKLAKFFNHLD